MTTYEYDDAGRLVRAVTSREVEWDDEQRTWMQALDELEGQSCSGCGGFLPHTTALEMDEGFVADPPYRCHRCTALTIRRKAVADAPHPEAFTVWPVHEKRR